MFIRNISKMATWVAGVTIPPNKVIELPNAQFLAWMRSGASNRAMARTHLRAEAEEYASDTLDIIEEMEEATAGAEGAPEPTEREVLIESAIRRLAPDNSDLWTNDGRPKLDVLRNEAEMLDVTGDERDSVWERVRDDIAPEG